VGGEPISGNADNVLSNRKAIQEVLDNRLEAIRSSQTEHIFKDGEKFSKEQETILDFITHYVQPTHGKMSAPVDEHETLEQWAEDLRERLQDVKLANTLMKIVSFGRPSGITSSTIHFQIGHP